MPGMGPNNREDRIMVNRMGIPASVQERWDWNIIASSEEPQENSMFGTVVTYVVCFVRGSGLLASGAGIHKLWIYTDGHAPGYPSRLRGISESPWLVQHIG